LLRASIELELALRKSSPTESVVRRGVVLRPLKVCVRFAQIVQHPSRNSSSLIPLFVKVISHSDARREPLNAARPKPRLGSRVRIACGIV
jgi:hypothetical protein